MATRVVQFPLLGKVVGCVNDVKSLRTESDLIGNVILPIYGLNMYLKRSC